MAETETQAATTYVRNELFLGPVRTVRLPEKEQKNGVVIGTKYELNVIDGWARTREWTDDSGVVWQGQTIPKPCRVGAVLDAAPGCAEFIAVSHLLWIKALQDAGRTRQASSQRRALNDALRHHGLMLKPEGPRD